MRPAFSWKFGSRGKIQQRCCQGRMASSCSQRQTVLLLMRATLAAMDLKFSAMYQADIRGGRPSIAPEKLMRAMLLQVLYSVRSERGSSSSRSNRSCCFGPGTATRACGKDDSDDGRPPKDWRGELRSNETHGSTTDPDSRLYRKSNAAPALPSHLAHVVTDNRHGLVVNPSPGGSGRSPCPSRSTAQCACAGSPRSLGAGCVRSSVRGLDKIDQLLTLTLAAYNGTSAYSARDFLTSPCSEASRARVARQARIGTLSGWTCRSPAGCPRLEALFIDGGDVRKLDGWPNRASLLR